MDINRLLLDHACWKVSNVKRGANLLAHNIAKWAAAENIVGNLPLRCIPLEPGFFGWMNICLQKKNIYISKSQPTLQTSTTPPKPTTKTDEIPFAKGHIVVFYMPSAVENETMSNFSKGSHPFQFLSLLRYHDEKHKKKKKQQQQNKKRRLSASKGSSRGFQFEVDFFWEIIKIATSKNYRIPPGVIKTLFLRCKSNYIRLYVWIVILWNRFRPSDIPPKRGCKQGKFCISLVRFGHMHIEMAFGKRQWWGLPTLYPWMESHCSKGKKIHE